MQPLLILQPPMISVLMNKRKWHGQYKPTQKQIKNSLNLYDKLFNKNFMEDFKNEKSEEHNNPGNRRDNRNRN